MHIYSDNFQDSAENKECRVSLMSRLGDRDDQQDSIDYICNDDGCLVVLCDGMGGHNGGKLASSLAVDTLIKKYTEKKPSEDIADFYISAVQEIDAMVAGLTDDSGCVMKAGSTIVSAVVRNNCLYWLSVGDSRLYILREEELVQATEDHIYRYVLEDKLQKGLISEAEYQKEMEQEEVLVSFLGINGLPKINVNEMPFPLIASDIIIMMSDGLYKLVSDEELKSILSNFKNTDDALNALEMKAQSVAKRNRAIRDNMTIAIIKIKDGGTL